MSELPGLGGAFVAIDMIIGSMVPTETGAVDPDEGFVDPALADRTVRS